MFPTDNSKDEEIQLLKKALITNSKMLDSLKKLVNTHIADKKCLAKMNNSYLAIIKLCIKEKNYSMISKYINEAINLNTDQRYKYG